MTTKSSGFDLRGVDRPPTSIVAIGGFVCVLFVHVESVRTSDRIWRRHSVVNQVQSGFKIIDVKNDFVLTDGERIQVIEVRKEKPDFRAVDPDRSL
jgi:hypothetical protein